MMKRQVYGVMWFSAGLQVWGIDVGGSTLLPGAITNTLAAARCLQVAVQLTHAFPITCFGKAVYVLSVEFIICNVLFI